MDREKGLNSLIEVFSVHRQFASHQIDTHEDITLSRAYWKLDKIPNFSLRPLELLAIDMVGKHCR